MESIIIFNVNYMLSNMTKFDPKYAYNLLIKYNQHLKQEHKTSITFSQSDLATMELADNMDEYPLRIFIKNYRLLRQTFIFIASKN